MKLRLLSAVYACVFSASVNAAVVLFDTTEIVFSASGSANTIAGSWSANSMIIPTGADVSFFTLEVTGLSVSGNYGNPSSITLMSQNSPQSLSNAGISISLCGNPSSCVTTVDIGSTATIGSSQEWDFLARIIENYASPFTTSDSLLMSWSSGGFDVSTDGVLSIAAYGESVVPVPAAVWLFTSGLIGFIGIARCKKIA